VPRGNEDGLTRPGDGEHGGAGRAAQIDVGERAADGRTASGQSKTLGFTEAPQHLPERRIVRRRGARCGERFGEHFRARAHVSLQIAHRPPQPHGEDNQSKREHGRRRTRGQEGLGSEEQREPERHGSHQLQRHDEGPSRCGGEVHLARRTGGKRYPGKLHGEPADEPHDADEERQCQRQGGNQRHRLRSTAADARPCLQEAHSRGEEARARDHHRSQQHRVEDQHLHQALRARAARSRRLQSRNPGAVERHERLQRVRQLSIDPRGHRPGGANHPRRRERRERGNAHGYRVEVVGNGPLGHAEPRDDERELSDLRHAHPDLKGPAHAGAGKEGRDGNRHRLADDHDGGEHEDGSPVLGCLRGIDQHTD